MDPKIPPAPAPPSDAATFLSDLPSRGLFSATPTIPSSTFGSMRVYICEHDTSPPSSQLIKTDQMNILIRSLLLKKPHPRTDSRKRAADKDGNCSASGKRAAVAEGEGKEVLQCLTVERLRVMLREKGLNVKGKKDELIARLRTANANANS